MRRINEAFHIGIVATLLLLASLLAVGLPRVARADVAFTPSLVISQLKITSSNGQFITLYNSTDMTLDMSKYQLEYFNSYDLNKSTSSRLIALSGQLPPHSYFMVNDDSLLLCYQLLVDSVSLGLSSTAGLVEVLSASQNSPGGSVAPVLQDYVGWAKTPSKGAQTLPSNASAFLQRQPVDAYNNPSVSSPGTGSWQNVQPDTGNPCRLVSSADTSLEAPTGLSQFLPGVEAPATIISAPTGSGQAAPAIPASDIGLMSPSITELLPNPSGTGNDSSNEFIELYNPNATTFDLSSFILQTGLTTTHNYTFPGGTRLPPHGFTAFYSATTRLSLSNASGQAKLLDPFGNSIAASGAYGTAKDGLAWALAKGKWYWTSDPTPGKPNVIKQPATTKKSRGAKTSKAKKVKGITTKPANAFNNSGEAPDDTGLMPVHMWVLAMVGAAALLYGAYEYRADLANHFHQFKRNIKARRSGRP
jgi:hypothetical protein